jgi:hypothetical protein
MPEAVFVTMLKYFSKMFLEGLRKQGNHDGKNVTSTKQTFGLQNPQPGHSLYSDLKMNTRYQYEPAGIVQSV